MLVLTRQIGEEIVIDGNIRVGVVKIARNKVRLTLVTPEGVRVRRHEVLEREGAERASNSRAAEARVIENLLG